ncbi:unnamed protein product [Parajaminaea phylloscopi]
MAEGSAAKLTKKQRKAADFKQQKKGGSSSSSAAGSKRRDKATGDAGDVPEEDLLDEQTKAEDQEPVAAQPEASSSKSKDTKKSKAAPADKAESSASGAGQKRKRDEKKQDKEQKAATTSKTDSQSSGQPTKTSWDESGEAKEVSAAAEGKKKATNGSGEEANRKLIVFVGNMSFKSTAEQIKAHFASHCDEEPSVRLLTTKSDPSKLSKSKQKSISKGKAADTTVRSKGCAFVEFKTVKALQKALGLHHLLFGGRQINVELTAGGGGNKSATRNTKIAEKNRILNEERKKLHEKYVQPAQEKRKADVEEKRARGEDVGPPRKKAKAGDEGEAQWGRKTGADSAPSGGAGPARSKKSMPRWMASGANAVRLSG